MTWNLPSYEEGPEEFRKREARLKAEAFGGMDGI
jgi:hypothetical protein